MTVIALWLQNYGNPYEAELGALLTTESDKAVYGNLYSPI
jgi:hypothetical protein